MSREMEMEMTKLRIQLGDYLIIQRQKYMKMQKFDNIDSLAVLGKEKLELRGLLNMPYSATYKMIPKEATIIASEHKKSRQRCNKRVQALELCDSTELRNIRDVVGVSTSGEDNRNIIDDGESQTLRPEDIRDLREECNDSTKIIEQIIQYSKTFHTKTEYSQEKYLKKKEKKYFEFVQIRRPTVRLMAEIYYRQDAEKIMGLRIDIISQILSYSGVSANGNFLLYESGTQGLLPACFLNAMGAGTESVLVHIHPGCNPQRQAILALNLPQEQVERCISVNVYSVLRTFYQGTDVTEAQTVCDDETTSNVEDQEPSNKKQKLEADEKDNEPIAEKLTSNAKNSTSSSNGKLENQRACALLHNKFDSLVIAAREHPDNIIRELLPFVKPSRPIVIFSQCKEVLMELYVQLKTDSRVTNLHLVNNWMRMYQILPNRTHPEVNMNSNSGFILYGYTLDPTPT